MIFFSLKFLRLVGFGESFDMRKLMFEIIVHNGEYEHAYGILPFFFIDFEVLMLQKNILEEHAILKVLTVHLRIFHKLFEGKHALDIQEKKGAPDNVPEQVATFADDNLKFFFVRIDTGLKEITCWYSFSNCFENKGK